MKNVSDPRAREFGKIIEKIVVRYKELLETGQAKDELEAVDMLVNEGVDLDDAILAAEEVFYETYHVTY